MLGNALRYATRNDAAVCITVYALEHSTEIDIVDDGPGVPEGVRAHLFEPFFTTHSRGTGLGLYIARELCDANGATLDFVDNAPGARFRLRGMGATHAEKSTGRGGELNAVPSQSEEPAPKFCAIDDPTCEACQ